MKKYMYLAVAAIATLLYSCDKDDDAVQDFPQVSVQARVKFYNFGVSAPGVNFYANDTKVTAISSATGAESTTGIAYGGVSSGDLYTNMAAGQYTFRGKIAAATDKDLAISNIPGTVESGKYYSVYQSGVYNTTAKTIDGFIVEDAVPAIDTGKANVRVVNAVSNVTGPVVLYVKHTVTLVETAINPTGAAYKTGSAFMALPNGVYDLSLRYVGSGTNLVTRTGVSFSKGRVNTIGVRGQVGGTGTAALALDNTLNR